MTSDEGTNFELSVIVPTRNSERTLFKCLSSIKHQTIDGVELIVVDNRSEDATPLIAQQIADTFISAGPERSAQRNVGLRAAKSSVVLFVDSDMELPATLGAEILEALSKPGVRAVVIPEAVEGDSYWLRCRNLEKHLCDGDKNIEAPRAFGTADVLNIGGYDEALTGGEDWEMPQRLLRQTPGATERTNARIIHDEDGLSPLKSFKKKLHYGQGVALMLTRYSAETYSSEKHSAAPGSRLGLIGRVVKEMPRHPTLAVGVLVLKSAEYCGVLAGAIPALAKFKLQRLLSRVGNRPKPSMR